MSTSSGDEAPGPGGSGAGPAPRCVIVEAPASSANLGAGFDALAVALELRLHVEFRWVRLERPDAGWPPRLASMALTGEGAGELPVDATNRVWQAALRVFETAPAPAWAGGWAVEIAQANAIPIGAGLGSSAAAAVAGLWGANAALGTPLSYRRLLDMAGALEGHADNAAAAALGGLVACRMAGESVRAMRVPVPRGELAVVVALPERRLATEAARGVLPSTVPLADAAFNVGQSALTVAALTTGQFEHLRDSMIDRLHQPYRESLVPALPRVIEAALHAGAWGAALSGAGPSVMAFSRPDRAGEVGRAMVQAFGAWGEMARYLEIAIASEGVRVRTASEELGGG